MTTLADLITVQTPQTISGYMLGYLASVGFPVQSWQPGGAERTRIMAFATATADISGNYIPQAAAGGFLDYASLPWLQLTAAELYNLVYNPATQTVGTVAITPVAGAGPYTYSPGQLIAVFAASGRRYINTGSGTIAAGPATTNVTFAAELTGSAYNDSSNANPNAGALITLATPLPGVTLNNPAGTFSPVSVLGSGTGSMTAGGTSLYPHQVIARADTTGAAAVFSWSYSLDGAPFVSYGIGNAVNLGGTGINLTFTDGATPASFVAGMTLSVQSPGSWITSQGTDVESAVLLAQRCRNRWASLSTIPTNGLYQLLATSTPVVGGQVTQIVVQPDAFINNQVNIIVAGPAGVLPVATVAAIQAYISPRVPITDKPVVLSPSTLLVTIGGLVTVSASQRASAVAAIQVALTNYVAATNINGTLRIAAIIDAVMNVTGVVDVSGVTINGAAVNLVLGSATSFVLPLIQPLALGYTTVAP